MIDINLKKGALKDWLLSTRGMSNSTGNFKFKKKLYKNSPTTRNFGFIFELKIRRFWIGG